MLMEEQATVGLRIKKLREQLELKQADFAQQLSEDPKKISRIEKEVQFPDSNFLIQLGDRLDVSLDWILRGVGKMFLSDSDTTSANFFPSEVDSGDFAFVPVYDVNASAGHGAFNDFGSEQAIQHMAFLNSWIHGNLSSSAERMVVIRAVGDSMLPTISNGDSLLLDVSPHFAGDGLYCVQLHETLFAKRVQRKSGHGYQLISDNPNYEPLEVNEEDEDAFRLIGRILWVGKQV